MLPSYILFMVGLPFVAATFTVTDPARLAEINKAYRMLTGQEVGQIQYTPLPTKKEIKEQQEQRVIAMSTIKRFAHRRLAKQKTQDAS